MSTETNIGSGMNKQTKTLVATIVGIVILVGGFFGYKEFIAKPNADKAAAALFPVEHWFEMDSLQYVLDGDGNHEGALYIINKFGGTDAGNQAKLYAGMAHLKLGQFDEAIKQLESFDGKKTPVTYSVYGSIGDAYAEKGDVDKAISYYEKAAEYADDVLTPLYMFRNAKLKELNGNAEEAIAIYQKLKVEFPFSQQSRDADKALGVLGVTE